MDISIIIPALNEDAKIARDVQAASDFISENGFTGEIIVVDDGSSDRTSAVASAVKVQGKVIVKILRNEQKMGKGYAVRRGILESCGDYVMFADAGHVVPFGNALKGLGMIKYEGYGIANGSRKTEGTVITRKSSLRRRINSIIFNTVTRIVLGLPAWMKDTQCGFKVYKGDVARRIYASAKCNGFAFDLEIIVLAIRMGIKIGEFPVEWSCDPDTRLSVTRELSRNIRDIAAIIRLRWRS
jgi:dolichyl-phosphate beta-glucosyltransferase